MILLILFLCLLFIHFILKDRYYTFSILYYACPLPLIILFGLLVTLLFFSKKRIFYILIVLLVGMNCYFFLHYFGAAAEEDKIATSSILFWNVAENKPLPTDIITEKIDQYHPEIIALVEALPSQEDLNVLKKACPDYQFQKLYGTMLVGIKGSIDNVEFKAKTSVYKFNFIKATINGKLFKIMIADVNAVPFFNKKFPLDFIHDFSQKHKVDVLLGDFNTPYESVFFENFKQDYYSFHPYSIGMTSTWPTKFPVIEIDQIWIGNKFQPIKMDKFCYKLSDHKMLLAKYK
ncbi:MAG: endonuclease/exonuclease/phosphatase family protein [Gelidibacter sp.]